MTPQQIKANAPEGATHIDSEYIFWKICHEGVFKYGWFGWVEERFPPEWIPIKPL